MLKHHQACEKKNHSEFSDGCSDTKQAQLSWTASELRNLEIHQLTFASLLQKPFFSLVPSGTESEIAR